MTALLVARPLVLGEDPGLKDRLTGGSNLVLSLLWLVAVVGWAVERVWSRRDGRRFGPVEAGLAALVVCTWVSALGAAHYRHPALLIAWEWLILLIAFGLVRRLARTLEENAALLAAVLAGGVSLSAQAVYQYTIELPQTRQKYQDPETLRQELETSLAIHLEPGDPHLDVWKQRIQMDHVFATFAHPNSFAGYLALLLPALGGWAWVAWRQGWGWQTWLVAACALLMGLALAWTHSRGAILGILLVSLALLVLGLRQRAQDLWRKAPAGRSAGAIVLALVLLAAAAFWAWRTEWARGGLAKFWQSSDKRMDYWIATAHMIHDHPWLGVGPGNFSEHYPRYMLPRAFEKIQDPHNFLLEVWATAGVFALLALLVTLASFFWSIARAVGTSEPEATSATPPHASGSQPDAVLPIRWEFYLGGSAGLLLGFLLRAADQTGSNVLLEGLFSFVRSLIWFGVFILLSSLAVRAEPNLPGWWRWLPIVLTGGVAALLLNLLFSGGIGMPSVAGPLWVVAALALNTAEATRSKEPAIQGRLALLRKRWAAVLPLPILAGLALVYLLGFFYPVTSCLNYLNEARRHYGNNEQVRGWQDYVKEHLSRREANFYLERYILRPLKAAAEQDPGYTVPPDELASWYGEQWNLYPDQEGLPQKALAQAQRIQALDPDSREGYVLAYQLYMQMADRFKPHSKQYHGAAALAMQEVVDLDPTEAGFRYQLAEVLFLLGDGAKGQQEAERARDLDAQATQPERKLSEAQRQQISRWLGPQVGRAG